MTTDSSSTVDATSDVVMRTKKILETSRTHESQQLLARVQSLKERGFLRKQEYSSTTSAEFEKQYCYRG